MSGSDYELIRSANIERNEQFLRELGIGTSRPKSKASSSAHKTSKKKRKYKEVCVDESSLRRSTRTSRSSGTPDELKELKDDDGDDGEHGFFEEEETRKKVTAKYLREAIETESKADSSAISNQAIVHCVDRLNSMSVKALGSRIRTISKAAGKNSREKLLVFYYALREAGLLELSEEAQRALSRD